MNKKRIQIGRDKHGFTYHYDPGDRYVYQFHPATNEWNGWLCAGSSWEVFRRNMLESIAIEDIMP